MLFGGWKDEHLLVISYLTMTYVLVLQHKVSPLVSSLYYVTFLVCLCCRVWCAAWPYKKFSGAEKGVVRLTERWQEMARDKERIKCSKLMFSLDNLYHETIAQGHTINMKQLSLSSVLSNAAEIYFNKCREILGLIETKNYWKILILTMFLFFISCERNLEMYVSKNNRIIFFLTFSTFFFILPTREPLKLVKARGKNRFHLFFSFFFYEKIQVM